MGYIVADIGMPLTDGVQDFKRSITLVEGDIISSSGIEGVVRQDYGMFCKMKEGDAIGLYGWPTGTGCRPY